MDALLGSLKTKQYAPIRCFSVSAKEQGTLTPSLAAVGRLLTDWPVLPVLTPKPPVVNGRNRATQSGGGPLTATSHGSGGGERDLALAQVALCGGARAVLKVLDHMIAEVQRTHRAPRPADQEASRPTYWSVILVCQFEPRSGRRLDRDHLNSSAEDRTTAFSRH